MSLPDPRDDFAAIPILLEPVPEPAPEASAEDAPMRIDEDAADAPEQRPVPGREAQQSLFDEPAVPAPVAATPRRRRAAPSLQQVAENLLRARAPAIIDELVEAEAGRLAGLLHERLRAELARLMAELAAKDPDDAGNRPL